MGDAKTRFTVLLFSDIVDSAALKEVHGVPAYSAALSIHNGHFERLVRECGLTILQNMGDGYFAEAGGVAEAVRFSLRFQDAMREGPWGELRLTTRIGIHAGEVSAVASQGGSGIVAPAADLAARVMSLALGGQILLTRFVFDEARHFIREHPDLGRGEAPALSWLAHGPYLMKGREEPVEVFEVGAEGLAPLVAPPGSEKVKRAIRPGEEETLGWRPAIGLEIPGRPGWHLVGLLGAGGFGEVWAGEHTKLRQRRAFKFCFDDERLRALKREVTLVRLLQSALGQRDDIVHIHELKLDEPPFYLESDLAPHGNLLQWAEKQGGLDQIPLERRVALVAHTATALAAAHSLGVLHKDIKPTNILIFDGPDGEPRPRLVDFGIGTLADPSVLGLHGVTSAGFTRATIQHSTGTPTYSPPEYLAGRPYTIQGDIYGLGVLLYQLVTAKPNEPLAPGWERDIADPLLREDIAACVDGDPARRLPSAADLAERLLHLDQRRMEAEKLNKLIREASARADRARRLRVMMAGAAALVVSLTGSVAVYAWKWRESILARERLANERLRGDQYRDLGKKVVEVSVGQSDQFSFANDLLLSLLPAADPELEPIVSKWTSLSKHKLSESKGIRIKLQGMMMRMGAIAPTPEKIESELNQCELLASTAWLRSVLSEVRMTEEASMEIEMLKREMRGRANAGSLSNTYTKPKNLIDSQFKQFELGLACVRIARCLESPLSVRVQNRASAKTQRTQELEKAIQNAKDTDRQKLSELHRELRRLDQTRETTKAGSLSGPESDPIIWRLRAQYLWIQILPDSGLAGLRTTLREAVWENENDESKLAWFLQNWVAPNLGEEDGRKAFFRFLPKPASKDGASRPGQSSGGTLLQDLLRWNGAKLDATNDAHDEDGRSSIYEKYMENAPHRWIERWIEQQGAHEEERKGD